MKTTDKFISGVGILAFVLSLASALVVARLLWAAGTYLLRHA